MFEIALKCTPGSLLHVREVDEGTVAAKVHGTVMMWQFDAVVRRQRGSECHRLLMLSTMWDLLTMWQVVP